MADLRTPGTVEVLDALALVSGQSRARLKVAFRSAGEDGDTSAADQARVVAEIEAVIRYVQLALVAFDSKSPVIDLLKVLLEAPPAVSHADVEAWRTLRKRPRGRSSSISRMSWTVIGRSSAARW